jgi:hypothetical protein
VFVRIIGDGDGQWDLKKANDNEDVDIFKASLGDTPLCVGFMLVPLEGDTSRWWIETQCMVNRLQGGKMSTRAQQEVVLR